MISYEEMSDLILQSHSNQKINLHSIKSSSAFLSGLSETMAWSTFANSRVSLTLHHSETQTGSATTVFITQEGILYLPAKSLPWVSMDAHKQLQCNNHVNLSGLSWQMTELVFTIGATNSQWRGVCHGIIAFLWIDSPCTECFSHKD